MEMISRLSIGTMKLLRLPSVLLSAFGFPRLSIPLQCCSFLFAHPAAAFAKSCLDCFTLRRSILIPFLAWRRVALPCSRAACCAFEVFLDPGRILPARPYRKLDVVPTVRKVKTSTLYQFSRLTTLLQHSLFTLHADISANYAKLASGG